MWTSDMAGSRSLNNAMGTLGLYLSAFEKISGRLSLRSDKVTSFQQAAKKRTCLLVF